MRGNFRTTILSSDKKLQAYIIGVALGDGNISNPNRRSVRLRITCDTKYPKLIDNIVDSLSRLLPQNKVGTINRDGCIDVSVYSNHLPKLLDYKWDGGPKDKQNVSVPMWVRNDRDLSKECLLGLLQTDGCLYFDRGYPMINFVNHGYRLAKNVFEMIKSLGYLPKFQFVKVKTGTRYTVRLSKNVKEFINEIGFWKA